MKSNKVFFFIYVTYWFANVMLMPYLGLFYVDRGLSGAQISILSLAEGIVAPLAALVISAFMSKCRNISLVYSLLPVLCSLGALWMFFSHRFIFCLITVTLLYMFMTPCCNTTDRLLIARIHDRPQTFGFYRLGGSVGYGIGALTSSVTLAAFGYKASFVAFIAGMLVTAILCLRAPVDDSVKNSRSGGSFSLEYMKPDKRFFKIYIPLLCFGVLDSAFGKFMAVHIQAETGSSSMTGMTIAFAMIGEIAIFLTFPYFADKISHEIKIALAFITWGVRIIAVTFPASFSTPMLIFMHAMGGCSFSLFHTEFTGMIEQEYPPEAGFVAQTLKNLVFNSFGYAGGVAALGLCYDAGILKEGYIVLIGLSAAGTLYYLIAFAAKKLRRGIS